MPFKARLTRKLHPVLGEEATADLVNWTQQVDAQRAELRELNELTFSRFDARLREANELHVSRFETKFGELELHLSRFDARLGELREEMRVGFADMRRELAVLEARFERRFSDLIKWSFVFWVGAVGAIAILAVVLR